MSTAVDSYASSWRPRDSRTRSEWAGEFVRVPNMARAQKFDISTTPWAEEPLNMSADNRVREMIVKWPTGAGKSNFIDAFVPHCISEDPGDILLAVQGNDEAKKYVEGRLIPAIRNIPALSDLLDASGKYPTRKFRIKFPHMIVHWGGVNETNAQATSVRTVLVDEAWMAEHGLLEQFRARLHSRWNRRFIALGQGGNEQVSIGGQMVDTEWHAAWLRTDQREWCFCCPQCNEVQRYRLHGLLYKRDKNEDGDLDETAVQQSARYQCIGAGREQQTCDAVFPDDVGTRRMLSRTARYVARHLKHRAGHHGWTMNALGIWYETWGDLAVMHANAHRARKRRDTEPFRLFRQKRMAENYREEEELPRTALTLGDYTLADYAEGQLWDGEAVRIATVDRQRDHFWLVIRAWKADGASRRIYVSRVETLQTIEEVLKRFKVKPENTFEDSGHEADEVYNDCGRLGWIALKGDGKANSFLFPKARKRFFFSLVRQLVGSSGRPASLIHIASNPIKRILEKFRGGYRQTWEVESDITPLLQRHLFSEMEKTAGGGFVQLHKENHTWDCEAYQVAGALMRGMLSDAPDQQESEEKAPPNVNA